jgi:very-long-chain (3R)-3-hydroxyacyl-CoA dehydratase
MLLAWSTTEVLRYTFYLFSILGAQPKLLTWLRYTTFYVLYPLGAGSEAALIFTSLPALRKLPVVGDALGTVVDHVLEKNAFVSWARLAGPARAWSVWDYARLALFVIWWPGTPFFLFNELIWEKRNLIFFSLIAY